MRVYLITTLAIALMAIQAQAQLHREKIDYKDGNTALEGYLVYDESIEGIRPGIVVVHEWSGLGAYVKGRADELARLGYVAFAVDIYGKGVRPTTQDSMAALATFYRKDQQLTRTRVRAGLEQLLKNDHVDKSKIAAIGYCFGGGVAIELARSGADILGAVSFHGTPFTANPQDMKNIKGSILILHGGSDPIATPESVLAFAREMTQNGVDWKMVIYGGVVHSFTNPNSGDDPSKGSSYNERAAKNAWQEMRQFFDEIFKSNSRYYK